MKGEFKAYRSTQVCPVCGHKGWCMYRGPIEQPLTVLCAREPKGCATTRSGKPITAKDGHGWFHDLRNDPNFIPRTYSPAPPIAKTVHPFIPELAKKCHADLLPAEIEALANTLAVSAESLSRLRVGWCKNYIDKTTGELVGAKAFTFPMRDAAMNIIGIKFRNHARYKWSVKGSLNGLFVPVGNMPSGPLLIVEGPTETASVLDMGFAVIGRPGNTCGKELCVQYCLRHPPRLTVILRNNDPAGSRAEFLTLLGANDLAAELIQRRASNGVKIIAPPNTKDARDWKQQGATKAVIEAVIRETNNWTIPAHQRVG